MRIKSDFPVPANQAETYALLIDLERVATCIPGGEVGPRSEDGSHPAQIAVRLGPMRMSYRGKVKIEDRDEAARRAVLSADVREQRGQGAAKATMTMAVTEEGGGSHVATVTEVKLTGRAAQMGRGVVDDVAARLVADMADCIAARLAPAEERDYGGEQPESGEQSRPLQHQDKPIGGIRLMLRVLWHRLKRLFRRLRGGERDA